MSLSSDFRDILSELNAAEARYLIVGAYAVAWYAEPRFTKDLDVWVDPAPDNAARVWSALARFGAPLGRLSAAELSEPGVIVQIGVAPSRIDVITTLDGVTFAVAWAARREGRFGGVTAFFIGPDELEHNKRTVGRLQDLEDVRRLAAARGKPGG